MRSDLKRVTEWGDGNGKDRYVGGGRERRRRRRGEKRSPARRRQDDSYIVISPSARGNLALEAVHEGREEERTRRCINPPPYTRTRILSSTRHRIYSKSPPNSVLYRQTIPKPPQQKSLFTKSCLFLFLGACDRKCWHFVFVAQSGCRVSHICAT